MDAPPLASLPLASLPAAAVPFGSPASSHYAAGRSSTRRRAGGEAGVTGASRETTPAVELRDVHKTYRLGGEPVHALAGVSLCLDRGSYTAVMGPSGSGKSTLMNLVGCLDAPTSGTIHVDGREVTTLSGRERTALRGEEIGFVFQTFNLVPELTAAENVALPMVFRGVPRSERESRARDLLDRVGLAARATHRPSELSGGQRQRVAIARALANDPALLLADEPTGNLDTETGATIMGLFAELHAAGNTVLLVTHERHVAEHADRIVHLLDGEIEREEAVETPRRVQHVGGGEGGSDTSTGHSTPDHDAGGREGSGR